MKDFDLVSKNVDDINKYSQAIISNVEDLKTTFAGFLLNRDYKDAYRYLDSVLRRIDMIDDNATKINWISEAAKANISKNNN